jgi:NAD(P)-dependent dehydrogenase (short-subunit alcohol dehydrogenase family)
MAGQYKDKIALVTGASGGIGMEIARELSRRDAHVLLIARRYDCLTALSREIIASGGMASAMPCDITDQDAVKTLAKQVQDRFGQIHLLINNAGRELVKPFQISRPQDFRDLIEINLVSLAEVTRCFLCLLKAGSAIVNIASVAGMVGAPGLGVYAASKGAVIALTRSLAKELAARKIRVNVVAPGLVRTEMTERIFGKLSPKQVADLEESYPLGIGSPQDISRGVAFLGSDDAAWITGQTLVIDGGFSA